MTDSSRFYQKNGLAVIMLSRDLLNLSDGDRMTPISEYEQLFGFSRWTIQTAIKFLVDEGCAKFEKRGPKGSYVYDLDYRKIWQYTGWNPLLGLAPLPSSRIHEALLTALSSVLFETKVPFNLSYMLPASRRFNALEHKQCHFIITSLLSARLMRAQYPDIEVAAVLTGCEYCEPYYIYLNCEKDGIEDGMRVAVYEDAIEQSFFTHEVCRGKRVTLVNGSYHDCQNRFESGEVDAHVQRGDVVVKNARRKIPLSRLGYDDEVTTPAMLVNKDTYGIERLLAKNVNVGEVAEIEKLVLEGKFRTRYF